tara:strand:+ start:587 stop:937 length:351 start_codon:yes stop_codon:yes gene_type:complete
MGLEDRCCFEHTLGDRIKVVESLEASSLGANLVVVNGLFYFYGICKGDFGKVAGHKSLFGVHELLNDLDALSWVSEGGLLDQGDDVVWPIQIVGEGRGKLLDYIVIDFTEANFYAP